MVKRRLGKAAKRSFSFIASKRRQTSVNTEALFFALLAAALSAAFIYELSAMSYKLKLVAIVSSAIGAVAYHLLFAARLLERLLGFDPASPPAVERRYARAFTAVVYISRAIATIFALFAFGAALALAPAIAASFGAEGLANEALYAAAFGAFFGLAAFVCAIYAFRKPRLAKSAQMERR